MSTPEDPLVLVRQRVDLLEISSQEKRRPWFRQPSNVVAIVALAVSIASTFYSQVASKQETIRSKKEELRKLVIGLVDLRQSVMKARASPESEEVQSASRQQGVYLQAAQRLVRQIPGEVSSKEYSVLAEELESAGEFADADDYFQKSVTASSSSFERAQALRALAIYYFTPGAKQDLVKGRAAFERATEAIKGQSDPYSIHVQALNYEAWAAREFQHGFAANATVKLEEARRLYKQLPPDYPMRAYLQDGLDRRVKDAGMQARPAFARGSMANTPQEISEVFQRLTADDLRMIVESDLDDGGTALITRGKDKTKNENDRRQYERLVTAGLATFMSDADVRQAAKKEGTHYDYGIRASALYAKTRDFLFATLVDAVGGWRTQ